MVEGAFYHGDKIPNWNKYKYHFYNLIITTSNSVVTHKQLPIFNTSRGFYNDNYLTGGSIALDIGVDEIIHYISWIIYLIIIPSTISILRIMQA